MYWLQCSWQNALHLWIYNKESFGVQGYWWSSNIFFQLYDCCACSSCIIYAGSSPVCWLPLRLWWTMGVLHSPYVDKIPGVLQWEFCQGNEWGPSEVIVKWTDIYYVSRFALMPYYSNYGLDSAGTRLGLLQIQRINGCLSTHGLVADSARCCTIMTTNNDLRGLMT